MAIDDQLKNLEKELVAEQPGFAMGVTGLVLALFIGLAIRTALSPERVLGLVEKAAANIDSRFVAHVGGAHLSFADGVFPELAVVVDDLTLESNEACWLRPSLEVNRLKLPIDFFQFLSGHVHVHEILAGEVSLSLRSDLSECHNKNSADQNLNSVFRGIAQNPAQNSTPSATDVSSSWQGLTHSKDSIDSVQIDRIRIHYLPLTFTSFEVRHLEVNLNSQNPKRLQVKGILGLNGETLSGDYSSTAFLKLDYEEKRKPDWRINLDGHWREGTYLLKGEFDSDKQYVKLAADMDQIPLNQLFPLLRKYHLLSSDFNGRQVWLSLSGGLEGPASNLAKAPAKFDLIRIEGNIGEIEARHLEVSRLEPFTFKPIDVDIKSLQLDSLMTFLNRPHPHPILGHLGVFHGKAHFEDSQNVIIKGENTGLEFVFSSRGVRQVQPISLVAGEIKFSQNQWNIKIDRLKPVEGVFLGDITVSADHDWKKVALKTKIDELTLGPIVQKLITNGGEIGSIFGDLQCRFDKGILEDISGNFTTADFLMDELNIKRSKINMSTHNKEVSMDLRVQGMGIGKGSPAHVFLNQIMEPTADSLNSEIDIARGSVNVKTKLLDDFHWEALSLQMGKNVLRSQGGWDQEGKLEGSIEFTSLGKKNRRYKLSGLRDHPMINQLK